MKKYLVAILIIILASCANRGVGPQGGPKDVIPPKILKEEPANGSVNQHSKVINLTFDEIVQLNNVASNVLISPPQEKQPQLKSFSKKVRITFEDELKDSTTYTIDFGSAIVDNNEKNPLLGYKYSFSTGDVIDTLQIAGQVIYAENLNPISDIYVGIHNNHEDSAFASITFDRVARTDSAGKFSIHNIHPGSYRLYALADINRNYKYDLGEGIAWHDSIITPTCTSSGDIVTYQPDNITMMFSYEDLQRHYFMRAYRNQQHFFQLIFATEQDSMPIIRPIGHDTVWADYTIVQHSNHYDTITYWLTDSAAIKIDTIELEMTYMKSDSIFALQPQTDTVSVVYRQPKTNNKNKKITQTNTPRVEYSTNNNSTFDIYNPLTLRFNTPISIILPDSIHLSEIVDTTSKPIQFDILPKDSSHMIYYITPKQINKAGQSLSTYQSEQDLEQIWQPSVNYALRLDSGAIHDIYGNTIDKKEVKFKTRSLDEYSTIKILLQPYDSTAIIEILNEKDKVIRTLPAKKTGTVFKYMKPESYYMRLYLDADNNSHWTPASWLQHKQPEKVYYFPNKLSLRANWDFEETWNFTEFTNNKPDALRKDQSKDKKKK